MNDETHPDDPYQAMRRGVRAAERKRVAQEEWNRHHAWKLWAAGIIAIIALTFMCSKTDHRRPKYDDPKDDPWYDAPTGGGGIHEW